MNLDNSIQEGVSKWYKRWMELPAGDEKNAAAAMLCSYEDMARRKKLLPPDEPPLHSQCYEMYFKCEDPVWCTRRASEPDEIIDSGMDKEEMERHATQRTKMFKQEYVVSEIPKRVLEKLWHQSRLQEIAEEEHWEQIEQEEKMQKEAS